eukprot:SAG31_NODE_78_length_27447_cov_83.819877_11_plen_231_part_00
MSPSAIMFARTSVVCAERSDLDVSRPYAFSQPLVSQQLQALVLAICAATVNVGGGGGGGGGGSPSCSCFEQRAVASNCARAGLPLAFPQCNASRTVRGADVWSTPRARTTTGQRCRNRRITGAVDLLYQSLFSPMSLGPTAHVQANLKVHCYNPSNLARPPSAMELGSILFCFLLTDFDPAHLALGRLNVQCSYDIYNTDLLDVNAQLVFAATLSPNSQILVRSRKYSNA